MIVPPHMSMKARTAKITLFSITWSPNLTGTTARGWMMRVISRRACLNRSVARIILMPPPVEPELVAKHDRKIIQMGANTGHCAKSTEANPVVEAMDTTLKAAWRRAVSQSG